MDYVMKVVFLGRACRSKANIKNRQPLSAVLVKSAVMPSLKGITDIAADELNVREVKMIEKDDSFISYEIKPQLKTLGPRYGRVLNDIRNFLQNADSKEIVNAVKNGGVYSVELKGVKVELSESDLLINTKSQEGFVAESDGSLTVVLDCELTPELIKEGIVREFVSKIQSLRKESGFEVVDHIRLHVEGRSEIIGLIAVEEVKSDVLCDEFTCEQFDGIVKELDINGEKVVVTISKV